MTQRPLRSGILVAVAGPVLGALPLVLFDPFVPPKPLVGHDSIAINAYTTVLAAFVWGGAPAILAAGLVAQKIATEKWISLRYWACLTGLCGLAAAITFFNFSMKRMFIAVLGHAALLIFFASTVFASVVLRFLLIALGWMGPRARHKPTEP